MVDWRRIGLGLVGGGEGLLRAYEAEPLRKYRQAQLAELEETLKARKMYQALLERGRPTERRDIPGEETPEPVVQRRSVIRNQILGPSPPPTSMLSPDTFQPSPRMPIGGVQDEPPVFPGLKGAFQPPPELRQQRVDRGIPGGRSLEVPQPRVPVSPSPDDLTVPLGWERTQPQPIPRQIAPQPPRGVPPETPQRGMPPFQSNLLRLMQESGLGRPSAPPSMGPAPPLTQPTFEAETTGVDLFSPEPAKYDQYEMELAELASNAGITRPLPPQVRPEWEAWETGQIELLKELTSMVNAPHKCLDYTDSNLQPRTTCMNVQAMTSPGLVAWGKQNHPRIAAMLPDGIGTVYDPTAPLDAPTSAEINERFIAEGASPDQIVANLYTTPMDESNPMRQRMNTNPLGGVIPLVGGGITFVKLSADNERFLHQMIPLSNVTMLIADYGKKLNKEDYAFLGKLKGYGQTVDAWFGLEYFLDPNESGISNIEKNKRLMAKERAATSKAALSEDQVSELRVLESLASDDLLHFARLRNAFAGLYAELGGERGRKTEDDVRRAKQMLAGVGDPKGLTEKQIRLIFKNFVDQYDGILYGAGYVLDDDIEFMREYLASPLEDTPGPLSGGDSVQSRAGSLLNNP